MRSSESHIEHFATRLLFFRQASGLTQQQLADMLDISLRSYQRFEAGELLPKIDFLYKFLERAQVSLDFFFTDFKGSGNGYWDLDESQEEALFPLFLPNKEELVRWQELVDDPLVQRVCRQASSSISGNKAMYVSTLKGSYQSPRYDEVVEMPEFSAYGEHTDLALMVNYWIKVLCSKAQSFLLRYKIEVNDSTYEVASLAKWAEAYDKSVLYGTTYNLDYRPDIKLLLDEVCGNA